MRFVVLALALAGCAAAAPRSSAPPVRVAIDHAQTVDGLSRNYDPMIAAAFPALEATGRRFVLVPDGAPRDVTVRYLDVPDCVRNGSYAADTRTVRLAPACIAGKLAWAALVAHELLHYLGTHHVCEHPGELPDADHPRETCSPVGYGRAVLNPYTSYPSDRTRCNPFKSACVGAIPQYTLTDLDLAELRRSAP